MGYRLRKETEMNSIYDKSRLLQRRKLVTRLLASGALGAAGLSGFIGRALAKGDLPAIPGVNRLEGRAMVNGKEAKVGTPVGPSDRVSTGPGSQAVIVIKDDAFLLRSNTTLEFAESRGVLSRILIETGSVLSVFGQKPLQIKAKKATIGIRGTGAYLEVRPDEVYFCLCYGDADLDGPGMPSPKRIVTRQHEQPLMITDDNGVMRAKPGPFMNHSDDELTLLEALVGREPPFQGQQYPQKRG
jgi:hypothetical protein